MAVRNNCITKLTTPSQIFACNVEKHGKAWGQGQSHVHVLCCIIIHLLQITVHVYVQESIITISLNFHTDPKFLQLISYRFWRKGTPGCLNDIYDGMLYTERLVFFSCPYNLSLTLNYDGAPKFKSSTMQIRPVQLIIDELPPHLRCSLWDNNIAVCMSLNIILRYQNFWFLSLCNSSGFKASNLCSLLLVGMHVSFLLSCWPLLLIIRVQSGIDIENGFKLSLNLYHT